MGLEDLKAQLVLVLEWERCTSVVACMASACHAYNCIGDAKFCIKVHYRYFDAINLVKSRQQ